MTDNIRIAVMRLDRKISIQVVHPAMVVVSSYNGRDGSTTFEIHGLSQDDIDLFMNGVSSRINKG